MNFEIGDKVKWNDPAIVEFEPTDRYLQMSRVFEVIDYINEDMDMIAI